MRFPICQPKYNLPICTNADVTRGIMVPNPFCAKVTSSRRRCIGALSPYAVPLLIILALLSGGIGSRAVAAEVVHVSPSLQPGTILVRTGQRKLYYVVSSGEALRYSVGVGRAGKQWFGKTHIVTMALKPAWSPPAIIRGNRPAWTVPSGSPQNPMGAAALVLADAELAIHGTNSPGSIGGFVSWGCIRMHNSDVMDLYARVSVGAPVVIAQ
jgi:lipoprotein-anchoring transpeptidase ErfK/SrfK